MKALTGRMRFHRGLALAGAGVVFHGALDDDMEEVGRIALADRENHAGRKELQIAGGDEVGADARSAVSANRRKARRAATSSARIVATPLVSRRIGWLIGERQFEN
jgi:hypothetical protein